VNKTLAATIGVVESTMARLRLPAER